METVADGHDMVKTGILTMTSAKSVRLVQSKSALAVHTPTRWSPVMQVPHLSKSTFRQLSRCTALGSCPAGNTIRAFRGRCSLTETSPDTLVTRHIGARTSHRGKSSNTDWKHLVLGPLTKGSPATLAARQYPIGEKVKSETGLGPFPSAGHARRHCAQANNRASGKKSDRRRVWHSMERGRRPRERGDPEGRRVWASSSPSSRLIRTDPDKSSILAMSPIMSAIILYMWRLARRNTCIGTLIKGELCLGENYRPCLDGGLLK